MVAEPTEPSTTVTMNADYTLVANFVRIPVALYVDEKASGKNDGQSWEDAFNELPDAFY